MDLNGGRIPEGLPRCAAGFDISPFSNTIHATFPASQRQTPAGSSGSVITQPRRIINIDVAHIGTAFGSEYMIETAAVGCPGPQVIFTQASPCDAKWTQSELVFINENNPL